MLVNDRHRLALTSGGSSGGTLAGAISPEDDHGW